MLAQVLLEGKGVSKQFGGLSALKDVSFEVHEGEVFGLIGPNGAGKTTLLNCISGVFPVTQGEIWFKGTKISGLKPYEIARMGIGRTFQVVKPFEGMTVRENVLIGALFGKDREVNRNMKQAWQLADEILEFVGLAEKRNSLVNELTVAFRKRLELARALAMGPQLLLLDEVMAGLNTKEIETTMAMVQEINKRGITILMIEHVMKAIMGVCDRIMVLRNGQKIAVGSPQEIAENEEVVKAYLGERWAQRRGMATVS